MQVGFEEFEVCFLLLCLEYSSQLISNRAQGHMTDMIHARIDPNLSAADRRPDLFSNLLKASDYAAEDSGRKGLLSKSELFGEFFRMVRSQCGISMIAD